MLKEENLIEFQRLVAGIATSFNYLSPKEIDRGISQALQHLGEFTGVDRAYISLFTQQGTRMAAGAYEWCRAGVESWPDGLRDMPVEAFSWWIRQLDRQEAIYIPSTGSLPPEATAERYILESQSIKSLLVVPMVSGGFLMGYLGFDSVKKEMIWSEGHITLLDIAAGILVNALERKRAGEKLEAIEASLHRINNNMLDMICQTDANGVYQYVSPSHENVLGYDCLSMVGKSVSDFVHPEDIEKIKEHLVTGLSLHSPPRFELRFRHADGHYLWLETVGDVICDDQGRIIGAVFGSRDITERKRAEWALRRSEERFRTLFHKANDAIFLYELYGKEGTLGSFIEVNAVASRRLGYTRDEFLLMGPEDITDPEFLGQVPAISKELRAKGRVTFETNLLTKEQNKIPVEINAHLFSLDQRPVVLSVARDISERKWVQEQTARVQRLASLSAMSAGIVHEIAQPLNAMKVMVDGMLYWHKKGRALDAKKIIENLHKISAQVSRIEKIIEHMRSFANVNGNRGIKPCNINNAVINALQALGDRLNACGIQVETDLSETLPMVYGNPSMLEEAVVNLLVNSIQALGGVDDDRKKISCSTRVDGDTVILEISDSGQGIEGEIRNYIFDPFFTTKPAGEGMGLGLTIVLSIVTSFNGHVEVIENHEGGATFRVELPAVRSRSGGGGND